MKISNFFITMGKTILFIGAIVATLSSISNITIADVNNWLRTNVVVSSALIETPHRHRNIALTHKSLNLAKGQTRYISSEQIAGPKTLEEAINFDQYPTSKVVATGYTAGIESTGKTPNHPGYGITYSGVKVKRDLYSTIAADLSVYPIGTILYIPEYGYGVVADKGGAITGNKIDLYYNTVEDVFNQWGKKELDVYIIEMGNGTLTEERLKELNENEALQVFREQITKN